MNLAPADALLLPLLVAAGWLGGCATGRRAWGATALGWGCLLLPGLLSGLLFVCLATGLPRPDPAVAGLIVVLVGLALRALRRRDPEPARPEPRAPGPDAWDLLPAGALLLALWVAGDWRATDEPGGSWDAMAIWNVGARFLHRADGDWARLFADRVTGHPDYPLFLPASIATCWHWLGEETLLAARSVGLLVLIGLGGLAWSALRAVTGRVLASLAAASLLATPLVAELTRAQVADEAVALALLAASAGLASRLDDRRLPAWLAGLALGLLPWIKNEGSVLALLLAAAWLPCRLLAARREESSASRDVLGVMAGAAVPLALVLGFRLAWAPADPLFDDLGGTLARHLPDPERWRTAWDGFRAQLDPGTDASRWNLTTSHDRWALAWPLVAGLALIGLVRPAGRRHRGTPFLGLVAWGGLVGYLLIYVVTPVHSQTWHIDTSTFRLLAQLHPVVLLWACALLGRPDPEPSP